MVLATFVASFKNMYFSVLTYCWILSWESYQSLVSLLHFDVGTQPRPSDEPVAKTTSFFVWLCHYQQHYHDCQGIIITILIMITVIIVIIIANAITITPLPLPSLPVPLPPQKTPLPPQKTHPHLPRFSPQASSLPHASLSH